MQFTFVRWAYSTFRCRRYLSNLKAVVVFWRDFLLSLLWSSPTELDFGLCIRGLKMTLSQIDLGSKNIVSVSNRRLNFFFDIRNFQCSFLIFTFIIYFVFFLMEQSPRKITEPFASLPLWDEIELLQNTDSNSAKLAWLMRSWEILKKHGSKIHKNEVFFKMISY